MIYTVTSITTLDNEERRIAARLLHLRTSFNILPEQLAVALDIEPKELIQYEQAIIPIPASLLALASIALGVEYDYFYQESPSIDIPRSPALNHMSTLDPLLLS